MELANKEAQKIIDDPLLLSWFDRDRDFESPQLAGEGHTDSTIPGYVDYAFYHGASLKIDIQQGRFVFFNLPSISMDSSRIKYFPACLTSRRRVIG